MELSSYISVFVQIITALAMGIAIVAASQIFGQRAKANKPANSAYECGVVPEGQPHPRFGARFYVVAMLFVIFDIEVVFLIPLAVAYGDFVSNNFPILLPTLFFIAVLATGVLYEMKKDALNCIRPRKLFSISWRNNLRISGLILLQ